MTTSIENAFIYDGEIKMHVVHQARRSILRVVRDDVVITEIHMSHETAKHLGEELWRQG